MELNRAVLFLHNAKCELKSTILDAVVCNLSFTQAQPLLPSRIYSISMSHRSIKSSFNPLQQSSITYVDVVY